MSGIILSEAKLEEWQRESDELSVRLAKLKDRIRVCREILSEEGEIDEQLVLPAPEPDEAFVGLRQGEAMLTILEERGEPLTGQQIREFLAEKGYPIEKWGVRSSYFYAVAKTLVDSGNVVKMDDKRYALPTDPALNSGAVSENAYSQPPSPDPDDEGDWPSPPDPDDDVPF